METKANYFIVGVFTLVLSAGVVLFIAWMMGAAELSSNYKKLVIYFPSNVNGLSEGSQVAYRGVQVGTVKRIQLDPAHPEYAIVTTHIQTNTPLHIDTRAVMANMGITGLAYIELESEKNNAPDLKLVPGTDHYVLKGVPSRLEQLFEEVPALVKKYKEVGDQLLVLLDKQNIDATSKTLANLEKFTHNLADQQKNINQIVVETRDVMHDFKSHSASSFNELNYFLQDSRDAAIEVKDLAKSLKDNPSGLIYQQKYQGYRVQK